MSDSKKVLLVGWDAADWKIIHPLMEAGAMPTVKRLVDTGVMGNLRTLWPVLSPMLWTSIATGKRPYKHGIHGFTEPTPDRQAVQPMTNASRTSKAVWNILNQQGLESLVVGWWPSHPAEPIRGAMVSDYYTKAPRKPGDPWKLIPTAIHPPHLYEELAELRVHPEELGPEHILPFVPNGAEIDQTTDNRLAHVIRTFAECTSVHGAATHLMETQPWDFMAVYYDAIDHFCHGYMRYHPPQQAGVSDADFRVYQHVITTAYQYHDMMLARLLELAGEDTTVILMSDHGFESDHLRPKGIPAEPAGPAEEHRDLGIFVINGPGIRSDALVHGANLLDITPTVLALYGLPVGEDMDGRVLADVFEDPPEARSIESWDQVDGDDGQHPKDLAWDAAESREALEQLIALGYIDRPSDNTEEAVAESQRELDYNLARAYMDGGRHGDAIPLLADLYLANPLEFRFGIQLANCLNARGRHDELARLIEDLNARWRVAQAEAIERLTLVRDMRADRLEHWHALTEMDEVNAANEMLKDPPQLAVKDRDGKPKLFTDGEAREIRKLRAVARGNPQTLDFLAANVAMTRGDFSEALAILEKARLTKSPEPAFQYHVGNVFLELDRVDEAQACFDRGLALDPEHAACLVGRCRTETTRGDSAAAIEFGIRAIGIQHHFPLGHYFLGVAHQAAGDTKAAIACWERALEQNPNFAEAHDRLADALAREDFSAGRSREHAEAAQALRASAESATSGADEPDTVTLDLPPVDEDLIRRHLPEVTDEGMGTKGRFRFCLAQPPAIERRTDDQPVIVVSGLPRSGTSMMMQMLAAAGIEPYTDLEREPDESNPKGYFEAELVKNLAQRNDWLGECRGKVVKVVAPLVPYLPQEFNYRVIMMQRSMEEVIESQDRMLERLRRSGGDIADEHLADFFNRQLHFAESVVLMHEVPHLAVDHASCMADPRAAAESVAAFLGLDADLDAMAGVVDRSLHRQRRAKA